MKRNWLTVALIAALFGILCASVSVNTYFNIHKSGSVESSFCSINSYINCDLVEASSYASFQGAPVAGFALAFYIVAVIFTVFSRFSKGFRKPTVVFTWWCSVASLIATFYMAYISIFVLRVICLTCVGMYLANIILFISLYFAMGIPWSDAKTFFWGYWATAFTGKKRGIDFSPNMWSHALTALVITAVSMVFVTSAASSIKRPSGKDIAEYVALFERQSKYDLKFDREKAPVWGNRNAKVTMVEFSDFFCPFCKIAAFKIKPFLTEFRNDIAFFFLNYPLDSDCNPYMDHQMHPGACTAAKAVICAEDKGKFWDFHDAMFRSKKKIDGEVIDGIARNLGLDTAAFNECIASTETAQRLKADIESARRVYITGTPSIFLNDRSFKAWQSPEILHAAIKSQIKASKSK